MHAHLTIGPGTHGKYLKEYLIRASERVSIAEYWPQFSFQEYENQKLQRTTHSFSFRFATWLLYGLNNKFSALTHGRQFQLRRLMTMYDSLCEQKISFPCSALAFSMTAYKTFLRNRDAGGINVLENGILHADAWMKIVSAFYSDDAHKVKPGFSLFTEKLVDRMKAEYEAAHYIHVHSSFARNSFVDAGISRDRIIMTPLGTEVEASAPRRSPAGNGPLRVLYFGRIELLKGIDLLLDAMNTPEANEIQLRLAGRIMPDMAERMKSNPRSAYAGILSREELKNELAGTDVVVFPSRYDAFGLVILEAMASGVPVLCSTSSAGPDIIADGVDGFLFDVLQPGALTKGLARCMASKDRLDEMGQAARSKVQSHFSMTAYNDRLDHALRSINFFA